MAKQMKIPFNTPYVTGKELRYISESIANGHLSGYGPFTKKCHAWLEKHVECQKALLTHSGTAALEMAAILADIKPGDEVIMPSYTFVSTANAFVLRGGVPVFVDIRSDTLTIDEAQIEAAITDKTKAIVPVHYAGVACEMDKIMTISSKYNLIVIEDAAHSVFSTYKDRVLGSIGHMASLSFHETKNIISGEGGALLINNPSLIRRAEIIWEKGTDRINFFRGHTDKYSWIDIGSSYLPSEITAAFLCAQMEHAQTISKYRREIWQRYHESFASLEDEGKIRRPIIPDYCAHNAHLYYLLLPGLEQRNSFISSLKKKGIETVFHYVPLHDSPAGLKYGRCASKMTVTNEISKRLVRLPLWLGIEERIDYIVRHITEVLQGIPADILPVTR